ncbi:MAG: hypothetical protein JO251_03750 [Verrucomicrobia bacterium]|nr:hypothetical protein [Verrucomicrobiota bacterium]
MILCTIDFAKVAEWAGNVAEWAAAFCTLGTLALILFQTNAIRKTVKLQTLQAVYSEMLSLDRFFFENCEFREYFYDGKEPPPDKRAQAHIVAELLLDLFDYVYVQKDTMAPPAFEEWEKYIVFLSQNSPVLRDAMKHKEAKMWYESRLVGSQAGD